MLFIKEIYMPHTIPCPRPIPVLRYMGILDFDGLYSLIVNWYKDNLYNFIEDKHEFKGTKLGKDTKVQWTGDKKITKYVKYIITIQLVLMDINKVEIIEDGVKKKRIKARLELRINAKADLDYEKRWETSEFNIKLRDFMHKYLIKYYIMFQVADPLYYKVYGLLTEIKKFLNMDTSYNAY